MVDLSKFVEIILTEQDDFLKVRETLTRIGVSSRKEKVLRRKVYSENLFLINKLKSFQEVRSNWLILQLDLRTILKYYY